MSRGRTPRPLREVLECAAEDARLMLAYLDDGTLTPPVADEAARSLALAAVRLRRDYALDPSQDA